MDSDSRNRYLLIQSGLLASTLWYLAFVGVYAYWGAKISAATLGVGVLVLSPLVYVLLKTKRLYAASLLFVIGSGLANYFSSLGFSHDVELENFLLPTALSVFLMFPDSKHRFTKFFLLVFIGALYLAIIQGSTLGVSTDWMISSNSTPKWFQIFNAIGAALSVIASTLLLANANRQLRLEIICAKDTEKLELERLQLHLEAAQEIAKVGSFEFFPANGGLNWSKTLYRIFGVNPETPVSELFGIYQLRLHPEDRDHVLSVIQRAIANHESYTIEHRICLPDGTVKFIRGIGKVEVSNGGPVVSGVAQDITDRLVVEQQLAQERLKSMHNSKLAALGELSAGVAHEINNPLAIIRGSLGLLGHIKSDPEKFESKLKVMTRATERIEKIVSSLKRFSRQPTPMDHQLESLSVIVQEALTLVSPRANQFQTRIETQIDPAIRIWCNPLEIEQVFINLLNNAIDANKNCPQAWVHIESEMFNNQIRVRVTDSGAGIPDSIQSQIFDPFFTTKGVGEGTGLGLSISKSILDSHGCKFDLVSGHTNTCFEISFPRFSLGPQPDDKGDQHQL